MPSSTAGKKRAQTASQIAKDAQQWNRWAEHHFLRSATVEDIPDDLVSDVDSVFDVVHRLPKSWAIPRRRPKWMTANLPSSFLNFLECAYKSNNGLFSDELNHSTCAELLSDLQSVHNAWTRLQELRSSKHAVSESDFALQVYSRIRVPGKCKSDYRSQHKLSLPQSLGEPDKRAAHVLNARSIRPDGALFAPPPIFDDLCRSERSVYKTLAAKRRVDRRDSARRTTHAISLGGRTSFKSQSTLCSTLPAEDCFEVAPGFWEDKKSALGDSDAAKRQNRMATASSLRQLHYLNVASPVFGLVFAEGTVQAHVDWWADDDESGFRICSAPHDKTWKLENPGDIIEVFLLIRNLDEWIVSGFAQRLRDGVKALAVKVLREGGHTTRPWRRRSDIGSASVASTQTIATAGESISSPVKPSRRNPPRSRKPRKHNVRS